jgi:hypothetical protein
MGSSKGSTPPPPTPDPFLTSMAQTGSNVQTAVANSYLGNANEISPYGNVNYSQIGSTNVGGYDVPQWQRTVSLSPEQQHLANQQQALGMQMNDTAGSELSRVSGILGTPLDTNSLPARTDTLNSSPRYGTAFNAAQYLGSEPRRSVVPVLQFDGRESGCVAALPRRRAEGRSLRRFHANAEELLRCWRQHRRHKPRPEER